MSRATVLALLLAVVAAAPAAEPEGAGQGAQGVPDAPAPAAAPAWAGDEVCGACHEAQATSHAASPHAGISDVARPEPLRGCEACHGPGQAHAEAGGGRGVGGLRAFARTEPARDRTAPCLACHAGAADLHGWKGGAHALAGVACTDCHRIHAAAAEPLLARAEPQLCYGCHLEIRAKLALTEHHPVNEGVVRCGDCHAVHGTRTAALRRGTNDRTCLRCHVEQEGPWVFEHFALVTEGCERCHDPHGSVNRHLLIRQQVGQLCYECHTVTPPTHVQPSYRDCTRCHTAIHGSNVDPRFLER